MVISRAHALSQYPALGQLIGGSFDTSAAAGRTPVLDPATGDTLAEAPDASPEQVRRAIDLAQHGFDVWRKTSAVDRARVLRRIADTMRARAEMLAALVVIELGKPWHEAIAEVEQAAGMWEWAGEEGRRAYGRIIPPRDQGARAMVLMEPIGPVAAFNSWNAPLTTPSRKMSGALGVGCSIILKAAAEVPASALAIGHIAYECGLPEGALSVLLGSGSRISSELLDDPVIRGVTFTGSTHVGKVLAQRAAAQMKRPIMELGGHAPVLVFEGVDVETVAAEAVATKYKNSGQICVAPTRFYVQRGIYEAFVEAFAAASRRLVLGSGFDADTTMGPLSSDRRVQAMADLVDDARQRGIGIAAGGDRVDRDGFFFPPTVIRDVPVDARVSNEEPFGPIAAMTPFDSYDEAIGLANRLPFALAAYVQARDVSVVNRAIDDLRSGSVICNGWRVAYPEIPFGGQRDSGVYSEGGIEGLRAFQDVKYAYLR